MQLVREACGIALVGEAAPLAFFGARLSDEQGEVREVRSTAVVG
jgi:hypothetical protein